VARKIRTRAGAGGANAAAAKTGAATTACVLKLACAVEQIEQEWWDAVEFSGCVWTACTTPKAQTNEIASMQRTLTMTLRFVNALNMILWCRGLDRLSFLRSYLWTILHLDGDPRIHGRKSSVAGLSHVGSLRCTVRF
jgi:hypothetical protein